MWLLNKGTAAPASSIWTHLKFFLGSAIWTWTYLKIFFSLKLISKETLFAPKFDSRMVNAYWLITWQVKEMLDYVNSGAVNGSLNKCIRRYFFSLSSQRNKEAKKKRLISGYVRIFWKNNVQEAYLPKMSILGQIVSEMLAGYTQKTPYKPF